MLKQRAENRKSARASKEKKKVPRRGQKVITLAAGKLVGGCEKTTGKKASQQV